MKKLFFLLAVSFISISILYYFASVILIPYNSEGELIVENYYLLTAIIFLSTFLTISLFHIVIDKLFFLRYDVPIRFWLGIRRGFLISVGLGTYLLFRLWGYKQLMYLIAIMIIIMIVEVLIILVFNFKNNDEQLT